MDKIQRTEEAVTPLTLMRGQAVRLRTQEYYGATYGNKPDDDQHPECHT